MTDQEKISYKENILACYKRATDSDVHTGLKWYADAKDICINIGQRCGIDYEKVAGIIAAFSPLMTWKENIALAAKCIETKRFRGHFYANNRKARKIFYGKNVEKNFSSPDSLKTSNFYQCIISGGRCQNVCVDRHALAIALGREATDKERHSCRRKFYKELAEIYQDAAKECGLLPSELQAITWVTWRREKGITD